MPLLLHATYAMYVCHECMYCIYVLYNNICHICISWMYVTGIIFLASSPLAHTLYIILCQVCMSLVLLINMFSTGTLLCHLNCLCVLTDSTILLVGLSSLVVHTGKNYTNTHLF